MCTYNVCRMRLILARLQVRAQVQVQGARRGRQGTQRTLYVRGIRLSPFVGLAADQYSVTRLAGCMAGWLRWLGLKLLGALVNRRSRRSLLSRREREGRKIRGAGSTVEVEFGGLVMMDGWRRFGLEAIFWVLCRCGRQARN